MPNFRLKSPKLSVKDASSDEEKEVLKKPKKRSRIISDSSESENEPIKSPIKTSKEEPIKTPKKEPAQTPKKETRKSTTPTKELTPPSKESTKKSPKESIKTPKKESPEETKSTTKIEPEKGKTLGLVSTNTDGIQYNPAKERGYHPINDAIWKRNER